MAENEFNGGKRQPAESPASQARPPGSQEAPPSLEAPVLPVNHTSVVRYSGCARVTRT